MATGALVLTFELGRIFFGGPAPAVRIAPPFEGEWLVLQGGWSRLQNQHFFGYNQWFALDLVRVEDGRIGTGGPGNAAAYTWEQPLTAPADGTVVVARGDMVDSEGANRVATNADAAGNFVVIELDKRSLRPPCAPPAGDAPGQRRRRGSTRGSAGPRRKLGEHDPAAPSRPGADPPRPLGSRQPLGALCIRAPRPRPGAQRSRRRASPLGR